MKKATKKEVLDNLIDLEKKYYNLVWFARTSEENMKIPAVRENVEKIMDLYPKEIQDLQGEFSDWHHGFNSGALAAYRHIWSMFVDGVETANENFPELDS